MPNDLIPSTALDKHIAALGATGSGKTSAVKVGVAEPILAAGKRLCVLDPTGAWWGLRLKADGKTKGFPVYIFGGDHGDYPLRARDAGILAETFATSSDSAIFDMSLMTVSERTAFFTEFAETIRRKNRGPLHLVIDEAHLFMPQAGAASGGAVPAMLHAGNNLVSLGRSRGLRIVLISQRPAKLHKDSLTQVQSLIAMRLMAPQDRKAIAEWIADQADPVAGKEIIASLPSLKPGEAWVWSPLDNVLRRSTFPLPKTYDSSKAPTDADGKGPELAPVDLENLKGKLASIEAEKKDRDPKTAQTLRAHIMRLETALASRPATSPPAAEALAGARADGHKAGHDLGYIKGVAAGRQHIVGMFNELATHVTAMCKEARRLADKTYDEAIAVEKKKPVNIIMPARTVIDGKSGENITGQPHVRQVRREQRPASAMPTGGLPKGEFACLVAAAQHPNGVTRKQLTTLTGYKKSTRDTYIQRMRERNFIWLDGNRVRATPDGISALGDNFEPLPTGAALRSHVLGTLPPGEAAVLKELIAAYPAQLDRSAITDSTGYQKSTRDTYLQRLSARELVDTSGAAPVASADLFD